MCSIFGKINIWQKNVHFIVILMRSIFGRFRRNIVQFIIILMCSIFGRFWQKNEVFSLVLMCSCFRRFWQKNESFFCSWEFGLKHILHSALFWMLLIRHYTNFLNFAYPETLRTSLSNYTTVLRRVWQTPQSFCPLLCNCTQRCVWSSCWSPGEGC